MTHFWFSLYLSRVPPKLDLYPSYNLYFLLQAFTDTNYETTVYWVVLNGPSAYIASWLFLIAKKKSFAKFLQNNKNDNKNYNKNINKNKNSLQASRPRCSR